MTLLARGVASSEGMRRQIADEIGITPGVENWSTFVNNHAWALVRLQAEELIAKVADGLYRLTPAGRAWLVCPQPIQGEPFVAIQDDTTLPSWAEEMRRAKNRINNNPKWRERKAHLSDADMVQLWNDSSGRCSITGLPFSNDRYGLGAAKRAFAPSLDRIDPAKPYTRENCRFVLAAVNFALNAFGDKVFDRIVLARRERIPRPTAKRLVDVNQREASRSADGCDIAQSSSTS